MRMQVASSHHKVVYVLPFRAQRQAGGDGVLIRVWRIGRWRVALRSMSAASAGAGSFAGVILSPICLHGMRWGWPSSVPFVNRNITTKAALSLQHQIQLKDIHPEILRTSFLPRLFNLGRNTAIPIKWRIGWLIRRPSCFIRLSHYDII